MSSVPKEYAYVDGYSFWKFFFKNIYRNYYVFLFYVFVGRIILAKTLTAKPIAAQ